jgi:hypothetical protein
MRLLAPKMPTVDAAEALLLEVEVGDAAGADENEAPLLVGDGAGAGTECECRKPIAATVEASAAYAQYRDGIHVCVARSSSELHVEAPQHSAQQRHHPITLRSQPISLL